MKEIRDAKHGDAIKGDDWLLAEMLLEDTNPFTDAGWPGCDFRYQSKCSFKIGVNVKVTGRRTFWTGNTDKVRCKIEFVGDYEPSAFCGGWLYLNADRR